MSNCTRISKSIPKYADRSDEVLKERIKGLKFTDYREIETYFSDLDLSQSARKKSPKIGSMTLRRSPS